MKKTRQFITNSSMFLILFFVLLQQSSRILSLQIGTQDTIQSDLTFYIILILAVCISTTILYLLPNLLLLEVTSCRVSINQPMVPVFISLLQSKIVFSYHTRQTYKTLQMIRC